MDWPQSNAKHTDTSVSAPTGKRIRENAAPLTFRPQDSIPRALVNACAPLRHCTDDSDDEREHNQQPTPVRFQEVTPSVQFTKFAPYILDYMNHGILPIHDKDVPEDEREDLLRCLEWCCIDDDDLHPCIRALHTRSVHEQFARLVCMHANLLDEEYTQKERDEEDMDMDMDMDMGVVLEHAEEDVDMHHGHGPSTHGHAEAAIAHHLTQSEKDFRSTPTGAWEHMILALHYNFAWVVHYIDAARNTTGKGVVQSPAHVCSRSERIIVQQRKRYTAWTPTSQDISSLIELAAARGHDRLFRSLWNACTWSVDITSTLLITVFKSGSRPCRQAVMRHANVLSVQDVTDTMVLMIQSTPATQDTDILEGLEMFRGFKVCCRPVLQAACMRGSIELLDYLLAKPSFVAAFTNQYFMQQCLHILAHNGFATTLEWLVNKQTHANVRVDNVWSLLQEAVTRCNITCVQWILRHYPHVLNTAESTRVVHLIRTALPTIQQLLFVSYEETGSMSAEDARDLSKELWSQALMSDDVVQAKWLHRFTSRRVIPNAYPYASLQSVLINLPANRSTPRIEQWLNTEHEIPSRRTAQTNHRDQASTDDRPLQRNTRRRAHRNLYCYENLVF